MIRVTVVSDGFETQVSNKLGELDSVKRDRFAWDGFGSEVKDSWLASLRKQWGFDWLSSTIAGYLINWKIKGEKCYSDLNEF